MKTIFIDGQAGTTGLQIHERLVGRPGIQLLEIPYDDRKDQAIKKEYLNEADLVVLCLPDQASKESAAMVDNPNTKILDASTAFRVADTWAYGLPELSPAQRAKISTAQRVSNPGCYPTGFILTMHPLIQAGIIGRDYPATVHAISGYSGGGKKLIAAHEANMDPAWATRPYRLQLNHKHIPEMTKYTGLQYLPIFNPITGDYYNGMIVTVPLFSRLFHKPMSAAAVRDLLAETYANEANIQVMPYDDQAALDNGFMSATACNGSNRLDLFVFGNDDQIIVVTRYDNLGKGASGAAVQNMNLMLGFAEGLGTELPALAGERVLA